MVVKAALACATVNKLGMAAVYHPVQLWTLLLQPSWRGPICAGSVNLVRSRLGMHHRQAAAFLEKQFA